MHIIATKTFTFEAAHLLPDYKGKCARLHGHSYRLEVSVSGPLLTKGSSKGMVIDLADVSKIVNEKIVHTLDHQYLNDLFEFTPTTELLAAEVFKQLSEAGLAVTQVKLWETAKSFITVQR